MEIEANGTPTANEALAEVSALLQKYRDDVFYYILAAIHRRQDADDVMQEVCLAALRQAHKYQPGTNFRAWVREIARLCLLVHARGCRHKLALLRPDVLEQLEVVAKEEDAAETEEENLRRQALRECLQSLGGAARRVIHLRYHTKRDVSQIAALIGRTVGATYTLLFEARQTLRKCIERKLGKAQHETPPAERARPDRVRF
ncbi:MAG: sigma-70 family RNA polymerase sigma factor [Planctomycetes bacterium]|nr:sigma-70 family RNA polymerase sigma factor [Planctomycetota bacterium]